MTAEDLISHFNNSYGMRKWPEELGVDHETYANVCQYLLDNLGGKIYVNIMIGNHRGIMFKGVELRLKKND